MPKQFKFHQSARFALKRGVDSVADAVKTTLGPRGRNIAIGTAYNAPTITHDGVTVAKSIELPNSFENMGAQLLVEVASRTNDLVGDGTTTATVIAQAMIAEGLKLVTAGANPMQIKRGLDAGVSAVLAELTHAAVPVRDQADIALVAGISAGDPAIGELIAEIMARVGNDGVVTIEEGRGTALEVEYADGMQIDRGYLSPYFVTDSARMEVVLDDAHILITDAKITSIEDILPMLEQAVQVTKNLVLVAEDIDPESLTVLVLNKLRGTFNPVAIKAPGFGDRRKAQLEDIAVLTGGTVISADTGRTLASVTVADLGRARRVTVGKDTTTFVQGQGDTQQIATRVAQIRTQVAATTSDFEREQLSGRLAKLQGCVAVLKVGATTEPELKEKKHRVEDALATARAAAESGIVPGGGIALLNALGALDTVETTGDERFGVQILRRALEEPIRQLATNAGEEGAVIIDTVRRHHDATGNTSYGYNVLTREFGSMTEMGVIDPVKVTKSAVQNAASIAGLLLTMEVLITDVADDTLEPEYPGTIVT